jgi:uncharacterized membrane protein YeaQ/YmgE (transglycosylase-associated protein family)
MSVVVWVLFGLVAGFIASTLMDSTGAGVFLDIALGIVGAVIGGLLFNQVGAAGMTGFNLWSLFVAVCGASLILFVYHAAAGRDSL